MNGLKKVLLGIAIILIAGFLLLVKKVAWADMVKLLFLIIGLAQCIRGVRTND